MSLYKDASLVMIPSAYKDGKLYSIRPTDGSGDFTFSRGSNLAATRVDVNGLIEKGRENLVKYSNAFNTGWDKDRILSATSGQTGYDGSSDAWLIVADSTNNNHQIRRGDSTLSGVQTNSVYAKYSGYHLQLRATGIGSTNIWVNFDLQNGTIERSGGGQIDANIESIGNGWYRCSIIYNPSSASYIGIMMIQNPSTDGQSPSFVGDLTSGIIIQDAQVEQGLVATDYIETGTSAAQSGILEDMPRLDYSGGASCPSLLLEPQRNNIVSHSEYVSGYFSSANSSAVTYNQIISPEGVQNAFKITALINGQVRIEKSRSVGGTNTYTWSVFLKAGNSNYASLGNFNHGSFVRFNLAEGTIDGSGGTIDRDIIPMGNGWYRCYMTIQEKVSQTANIYKILVSSDGNTYYANIGDYIYGYGAQLEEGSYPTSYIPTYGTSQTRSAENNVLGTPISLDGDFALFWEGAVFEDDIMLYGSGTNAWYMNYTTSSGRIILDELSGRKVQAFLGSGSPMDVRTKIMIRREGGVHSIFANGTKLTNTTSVNSTTTLSLSSMFWGFSSSFYKGLEVNQSLVFETALTDSECIALTTL